MLYQTDTLQLSWQEQGIAKLLFTTDASVNTLDSHTLKNLAAVMDVLEQQTTLKGLVLYTNKSSFIVGANIYEFLELFGNSHLKTWLAEVHHTFNRLEDLPVPTVTIVNGNTLGGGCELALATDFRLASPNLKIGLPEIKLGIMPGFGGTIRLSRLLGADNAVELISQGKVIDAQQALALTLVNAVVQEENLFDSALYMLKQAISHQIDWQAYRRKKREPLTYSAIEAKMSYLTASAVVSQASQHYPAPMMALKTIHSTLNVNRDAALAQERDNFCHLTQTPQARALVRIFLNDQKVKEKAKKRATKHHLFTQAGVLGAGIMGSGIAYQTAIKGIPIVIKDINLTILSSSFKSILQKLSQRAQQKKLALTKVPDVAASIQTTLHYDDLKETQILIEAVTEQPRLKEKVLKEAEKKLNQGTILASNTSTIPIDQLAKNLTHPERFCGMHFFNPVDKMPLIEIIVGHKTAEETIQKAFAYALQIGKLPILVKDCPGFFVNRVLFPYFMGFCMLLEEGLQFPHIDAIMEQQFGWPMGPAYLLDVVGIDTAYHAQQVLAKGFPDRMTLPANNIINTLFKQQKYGQKSKAGFYEYEINRKGKLSKKPYLPTAFIAKKNSSISDQDIIARLMVPMLNEVVRCLEEKIIGSPEEADIALLYGLGFPAFRGGAFCYLEQYGLENYLQLTNRFKSLGGLYHPPPSLLKKAQNNQRYYT